jgi:hypothetical protein
VLLSREGAIDPPIEKKDPWNYYGPGYINIDAEIIVYSGATPLCCPADKLSF